LRENVIRHQNVMSLRRELNLAVLFNFRHFRQLPTGPLCHLGTANYHQDCHGWQTASVECKSLSKGNIRNFAVSRLPRSAGAVLIIRSASSVAKHVLEFV
jgi:hypothetical protein